MYSWGNMHGWAQEDWLTMTEADQKYILGEKLNKIKKPLTLHSLQLKSMISLQEKQKLEFKNFLLVDPKLFYMTLLIVDIGINDLENTTGWHNAAFSSFIKIIKTFLHKTDEKEK